MHYVNPPVRSLKDVYHRTFFSRIIGHEMGYCIYLPPDWQSRKYPVVYHLHGWMGSESSEVGTMQHVLRAREAITVFPNTSPVIEDREYLPIEEMLFQEFLPLIESLYPVLPGRENRSVSGFSMGGGAAFFYAVKDPSRFSAVTAYAPTFHHYWPMDVYATVGAQASQAPEFLRTMLEEKRFDDRSILPLLAKQAKALKENMRISIHVGTADVLYCDSEIVRLHMNALGIPHEYRTYEGADHALAKIL